MGICKKYQECGMYSKDSQTCKEDYLARGNCGIRKDDVSPLKDNQTKERIHPMLVSVFFKLKSIERRLH